MRILHRIPKGSIIHACVGSHPLWEEEYLTAIVFSIDGKDIHEDTVVFITSEEFCIEQIPNKTELREEDDDKR